MGLFLVSVRVLFNRGTCKVSFRVSFIDTFKARFKVSFKWLGGVVAVGKGVGSMHVVWDRDGSGSAQCETLSLLLLFLV